MILNTLLYIGSALFLLFIILKIFTLPEKHKISLSTREKYLKYKIIKDNTPQKNSDSTMINDSTEKSSEKNNNSMEKPADKQEKAISKSA